jgi:Tetratricopeptide repeat
LLRQALALREQLLGSEHPNLAWSLYNVGVALDANNRPQEAEPFLRRAITLFATLNPRKDKEHPGYRTAVDYYDNLLAASGLSKDDRRKQIDVIGPGKRLSEEKPDVGRPAEMVREITSCPVNNVDWQRRYWDCTLQRVQDTYRYHRLLTIHQQRLSRFHISPNSMTARMWDLPFYSSLALTFVTGEGRPDEPDSTEGHSVWLFSIPCMRLE